MVISTRCYPGLCVRHKWMSIYYIFTRDDVHKRMLTISMQLFCVLSIAQSHGRSCEFTKIMMSAHFYDVRSKLHLFFVNTMNKLEVLPFKYTI